MSYYFQTLYKNSFYKNFLLTLYIGHCGIIDLRRIVILYNVFSQIKSKILSPLDFNSHNVTKCFFIMFCFVIEKKSTFFFIVKAFM